MGQVWIDDTTLRDGEQTAGVVFANSEKVRIAQLLSEIGVPQIEVGIPAMGGDELEAIKEIVALDLPTSILAWNRAVISDLEASLATGVKAVAVSISASDIHIEHKLRRDRAWVLESIKQSVDFAKSKGLYVSLNAEDASRADPEFLLQFARAGREHGADRLRFCDTLGLLDPFQTYERIKAIIDETGLAVEMHTHDDFGLATANALAGVRAGATFVNVTVNGLGERAGNAPLEEVAMGLKLLMGRGELQSLHGRLDLGILLVQDLAAVLMMALLPALSGLRGGGLEEVLGLLLKGAGFLVWVVALARWIIPAVTRLAAREYSKEIFVLLVAVLCFGGAASSQLLGLSVALGAFLAGLVVSESHYSHELLATAIPLRDLLGMVFFVSLGLLSDLRVLGTHPLWVVTLLATVLLAKPLVTALGVAAARYGAPAALLAGLGLGQIGEFSFLIVTQAWRAGLLSTELHGLLLGVATLSLLATPALLAGGAALAARLSHPASALLSDAGPAGSWRDHVILCGYGRVGHLVGEALLTEGVPFVVVEYDAHLAAELRERGISVLYGDASSETLLEAAGADWARLAVVALPEGTSTRLATEALRRANPDLLVIARAHFPEEVAEARAAGAQRVVYAELEAGLEMLRCTLLGLGKDEDWVTTRVDEAQNEQYGRLTEAEGEVAD